MPKTDPLGRFYTPIALADSIVRRCVHHVQPGEWVVEPSVGGGSFVRALSRHTNAPILAFDVDPDATGLRLAREGRAVDFLSAEPPTFRRVGLVVGNPPWPTGDVAMAHVVHALSWGARAVVLILPIEYLGRGSWYQTIYGDTHGMTLASVAAIMPRPWGANVRETVVCTWTRPILTPAPVSLGRPHVWKPTRGAVDAADHLG